MGISVYPPIAKSATGSSATRQYANYIPGQAEPLCFATYNGPRIILTSGAYPRAIYSTSGPGWVTGQIQAANMVSSIVGNTGRLVFGTLRSQEGYSTVTTSGTSQVSNLLPVAAYEPLTQPHQILPTTYSTAWSVTATLRFPNTIASTSGSAINLSGETQPVVSVGGTASFGSNGNPMGGFTGQQYLATGIGGTGAYATISFLVSAPVTGSWDTGLSTSTYFYHQINSTPVTFTASYDGAGNYMQTVVTNVGTYTWTKAITSFYAALGLNLAVSGFQVNTYVGYYMYVDNVTITTNLP